MYIYLVLIVYHIGLFFITKRIKMNLRNTIIMSVLFVLPLIFISAFKSINVGLDTVTYKYIFDNSLTESLDNFDKGFLLFNRLFRLMHLPFAIFLLICYTLIYGAVAAYAILKTNRPIPYLFLFCYFGFIGFSLSAFRQSLAIGIALIGMCLFSKRRIWSIIFPIITTAIAFTFHKSSFMFLIFVVLPFIKINKLALIYSIFVVTLISFLSTPLYTFFYDTFVNKSTYSPNVSTTFFSLAIYIFLFVLALLLRFEHFENLNERLFSKVDNSKFISFFRNNEVEEVGKEERENFNSLLFVEVGILILAVGANNSVIARFINSANPIIMAAFMSNTKFLKTKTSKLFFDLSLIFFASLYFVFAVLIKNPLAVADYSFGFMS